MKRLPIFFLLAMAFALLTAAGPQGKVGSAITDGFDTTAAVENSVDVIAWFDKGDTMTYYLGEQDGRVLDGDTSITCERYREIRLAVIDTSDAGYRLEFCLLSDSMTGIDTDDESGVNQLARGILKARVGHPAVLQLSPVGAVQHLENWWGYRDAFKAQVTRLVASLWDKLSTQDGVISQNQLVNNIMESLGSEEQTIGQLAGIDQIFEMHGMPIPADTVIVGDTVNDDRTQEHNRFLASFAPDSTVQDSTSDDFEGDYSVLGVMETTPGSMELGHFVALQAHALDVDPAVPEDAKILDAKTTQTQSNFYFGNGWLKRLMLDNELCTTYQDAQGKKHELTIFNANHIEWTSATWPGLKDGQ